jgi:tetratricopeptide (TPR) repeat protein
MLIKLHTHIFYIPKIAPVADRKQSQGGFKDAEFWYKKGYKMSLENNYEVAIDYYQQGYRLENKHFRIMYNLGCLYNSLNKFKSSLSWLCKAHVCSPKDVKPVYGLAIVMLRMKRYRDSLDFTKQAASMEICSRIRLHRIPL